MGVPGKVIRDLSEAQVLDLIEHAHKYYQLALVHAGESAELGFS
jgi:hypothetical protein